MPTFTMPSPLGAASDAVGSYVEKRDTNRDKALALSLERERMANDERHKTRELDLKQQSVESEVKSRDSQTKIAEAQEEYRKRVEPILFETAQQHLAGVKAEVISAQSKAIVDQADAEFKKKLHDSGLDMKQAELLIQQTRQSIATSVAQQHQAEAQTKATTDLLPGQVKQQGALTKMYEHQANAPYSTGSGAGQERIKEGKADDEADFSIGTGIIDDQLKAGKTPEEVVGMIRDPKYKIGPQVKLRLIRYIQTKPKAVEAPQGPGLLQNIGAGVQKFFGGGGPDVLPANAPRRM